MKHNWIDSTYLVRNLPLPLSLSLSRLIWVLILYKYVLVLSTRKLSFYRVSLYQRMLPSIMLSSREMYKHLNVERTPLDIARAEEDVNAKFIEICRSLFQPSIAI